MTLQEMLDVLVGDPEIGPLVRHAERIPAKDGVTDPLPEDLPEPLRRRLEQLGMKTLWRHQALAWRAAREGGNVAVVTGTSSGKTLCYNLPAVAACLDEPAARALYLFPTKALAQDQVGKLTELSFGMGVRIGAYDGDTPREQRAAVRRGAHIVLTNPDMLHIGILPQHETWGKFLRSLRLIAVDEMHTYRGVFGSHVGGVLRRLLRLCEWYGARPQIVACSATIGNPMELFHALTGRTATLIDEDFATRAERAIALLAHDDGDEKVSPNSDTARLLVRFAEEGMRTLAFCKSRNAVELVLRRARSMLKDSHVAPDLVESYRGGYTPDERRAIERDLFDGRLLGLASTTAMELGVDVGALNAVILNGVPGAIASFWQQVGRAGRRMSPGLGVAIAHESALEHFMVRQPELLFQRGVESAIADPGNPHILSDQLLCAAYERAVAPEELAAFGAIAQTVADGLCDSGELTLSAGRYFYPSHDPPAPKVSIRGIQGPRIQLMLGAQVLAEMERWRAMQYAHRGAVYLHRGQSYFVDELDLEHTLARLHPDEPPYFTRSIVQWLAEPTVEIARAPAGRHEAQLTGLHLTTAVTGFARVAHDGVRVLGEEPLDMPTEEYDTIGLAFDLAPEDLDPAFYALGLPDVHAAEHALLAVAPLLAGCERNDLGSVWYLASPSTLRPAILVFDVAPGGVGLAAKLFERRGEWLRMAQALLESCPCELGCPGCLISPTCVADVDQLSKSGALAVLDALRH